ncbi:hypothetical protein [Gloeothece verrucosa]|uniref:Uncharacterized protein n=1 Tax=Gloeothece verrucosa (strain PCC 7822) TaxID=497965 RepID=E0UNM9_GLOV7|nr:hypothetical protein [Gloeothece verrucosa]ADN18559.1 hypothetical protein Cyan7822_6918 [Gloeothece verrucosa PCC 7822]
MKNQDLKERTQKIIESLPLEKQLGLESATRVLIGLEREELEATIIHLMAREEAYRQRISQLKAKLAQNPITRESLAKEDTEMMKKRETIPNTERFSL